MFSRNPIISLFRYSWGHLDSRKRFFLFIALSFVANIIAILEPLVIGRLFNSIQFAVAGENLLAQVVKNLLLLIGITLGFWAFHGVSRLLENRNAFLVRKNYKKTMFRQAIDLPVAWHKNHHSGDTIDKINKAGDALFDFSNEIFMLVESFIGIVGSLVILALFDWQAVIAAIIVSFLALFSIAKFDQKLRQGYRKIFAAENRLAASFYDYIGNILTVITLRLKKRALDEIEKRSLAPFDFFKKNNLLNELKWFSTSLYIAVMTAGVLIFNAYHQYQAAGVILIGNLFTLYKYLNEVGRTFYTFAWKYGEIVRQEAAVRAAEVIARSFDAVIAGQAKDYVLPPSWRSVQIKRLFFSYKKENGAQSQVSDVSLTLAKGEKIALIGESGSGKSTVLALLRGLYAPAKIKVYLDGKKIAGGLSGFYEQMLYVPQDPEIFKSTVRDNIVMGGRYRPGDLRQALELSRFAPVVKKLKRGMLTNVLERGVSLSGGEKQRLALARGLIRARDYQFLLFDEPTSSVDAKNEMAIYKNIFSCFPEKTIVSAVHRLHLLSLFDYIYYFREGQVIAEGNFHTMLADSDFQIVWKHYLNQLPPQV